MKFKAGRSIQLYYFLVLIMIMGGAITWFYSYWKSGAINAEAIQTVFESSIRIDKLQKEKQLLKVEQFVIVGKAREAINLLASIDKTVRSMDRNVKHFPDEYENLSKNIINSKATLNNLLSLPDITVVFKVLKRKVLSFKKFAGDNKWPTLFRISSRMYAELDGTNFKKTGYLDIYRLSKIEKKLKRNINTMKKVTMGSILSPYDKNLIIARLKGFNIELKMLKDFLPVLKRFKSGYKNLTISYSFWIKLIEPEIAISKINFQKSFRTMSFSFAGIILFILISTVFGLLFYRRESRASDQKIERKIITCVKEGIISQNSKLGTEYSKIFLSEMDKYHSWIKNRMSFGNIFQEALPFPSLLLDSNLNLVWANNMFYDDWNLGEFKNRRDALNWEFLQRFTNLGENDPVLEALHNNIAGIYQIQVKQEEKDSTPYEMYISPVDQDEQKRIMIFFYPLMFLEETITDQKKSLVGPVRRSLEALLKGEFSKEFREKVKEDFNIAGIESVFGKFIKLNDFMSRQKAGLISEMEKLENELYDKHKLLCDLRDVLNEQNTYVENEVKYFQQTRDSIISLVEIRRKTEQIYLTTINASKIMLKEQGNLYENSLNLVDNHDENVKIFKNIVGARGGFKDVMGKIENCKSQIGQTLEQALIFTKSAKVNPSNFAQALMRIKVELKALDKEMARFMGGLQGFDIQLSKMQMVLEDVRTPDLSNFKEKIDMTRNHIENDTFNMGVNAREGQKIDEDIINKMKSFFDNLKGSRHLLSQMIELSSITDKEKAPDENPASEDEISDFGHNNESFHENLVI